MTRVAIPPWTATGLVPPVDPAQPTGPERSPYRIALPELILRFNTSPERRAVLDGFLRYRGRLHAVGLTAGFQWLNGSFMENIELLEARPPKDLDVVTFYRLPAGVTQAQVFEREPSLFPQTIAQLRAFKSLYNVDAYLVDLAQPPERLVGRSAYWYGMWSHRRDGRWKGYLVVNLDPGDDGTAAGYLTPPASGVMP